MEMLTGSSESDLTGQGDDLTGGRQRFFEKNLTGNLSGRDDNNLTGGQQRIQTNTLWNTFWTIFASPEEHTTMESIVGLEL